jgi:hypothetical protein
MTKPRDSRFRRAAFVVLILGIEWMGPTLGCGEDGGHDTGTPPEKAAVLNTIDDFYMAFTHAQPKKACALMTRSLRHEFVEIVVRARPSLKGEDCAHVYMPFYSRVPPENAPRAITLAASPEYPAVRISGDSATASYKDGGEIRLQKVKGRWLIAVAELLPTPTPGEPR